MAEYIDREALLKNIEMFCDMYEVNWTIGRIRAWINKAPAADVVEVKHGRWELKEIQIAPFGVTQALACTNCGYDHEYDEWFASCPNCGAKMEEQ